jgi:hypothetical protein
MTRVSLLVPLGASLEVKVTIIVHEAPAATELPHVPPLTENGDPPPLKLMLRRLMATVPVFVNVTVLFTGGSLGI